MYDHERWLSGKFAGKPAAITPAYLLQELRKLEAHLAQIDVYRMNRQLLHEYLLFLLRDENIGIIQRKASTEELPGLVRSFMHIAALLPAYYGKSVLERLLPAAEGDPAVQAAIQGALHKIIRKERLDRYFPWLALLLTLLICLSMYLFASRG